MSRRSRGRSARALAGPALVVIAGWWIVPAVLTVVSVLVADGGVGLSDHLRWLATDAASREAIRNTVVWIVVVGVGATVVGFGLAALADRLRDRGVLLTVALIPAIIAPVVVGIIWRMVFAFRPGGTGQVGLVNALWSMLLEPRAWLTQAPVNAVVLAGALVWAHAGVAMVVLSAAISRVPDSVRDAARVDGASEAQVFGRITVPSIRGAMLLAGLTGVAVAVRSFDIVRIATDGQYGTSVVATEMFDQAFVHNDSGRGASLAVLMVLLVMPVIVVAVRRLRTRTAVPA